MFCVVGVVNIYRKEMARKIIPLGNHRTAIHNNNNNNDMSQASSTTSCQTEESSSPKHQFPHVGIRSDFEKLLTTDDMSAVGSAACLLC